MLCSLADEEAAWCFLVMTSSVVLEWALEGVVSGWGGSAQRVCCLALLHGGLAHSFFSLADLVKVQRR